MVLTLTNFSESPFHLFVFTHGPSFMRPIVLTLTNFSESPLHLLTIVEAEILKNVVLHSVATALASIVFPVPAEKKCTAENFRWTKVRPTLLLH